MDLLGVVEHKVMPTFMLGGGQMLHNRSEKVKAQNPHLLINRLGRKEKQIKVERRHLGSREQTAWEENGTEKKSD